MGKSALQARLSINNLSTCYLYLELILLITFFYRILKISVCFTLNS